jgi:hypothetical protein
MLRVTDDGRAASNDARRWHRPASASPACASARGLAGGRLRVRSRPGHGTVVELTL